jgi:DNA-binding IclR family transcriptional regulator
MPQDQDSNHGDGGSKQGVAALERALSILGCFTAEDKGLTLTEIADRTGLYKSTILRLCESLRKFGYIVRFGNGRFVLGGAIFRLGNIYQRSFDVGELVVPILTRLAQDVREGASLWIREGDHRVCLYRAEAPGGIRATSAQVGERWPLERGGSASTVLKAFFDSPGARYDKVRRAGVAVSLGEFVPELAAVSCPVFSPGRQLIGALSVGGFRSRFTKTAIARFQARLLAAAREITDTLDDDGLRPRDNRRKPDGRRAHRPGLDD